MEPSYWPRHRLRAQGRPEARFRQNTASNSQTLSGSSAAYVQAASGQGTPTTNDPNDLFIRDLAAETSGHKAQRLLNYLSDAAREKERNFLSPTRTPDFAMVKRIDEEINSVAAAIANRNRKAVLNDPIPYPSESFAPPVSSPILMSNASEVSNASYTGAPRVDTAVLLNEWFNAPSSGEDSPDIDESLFVGSISLFGTGESSTQDLADEPATFLLNLGHVVEEREAKVDSETMVSLKRVSPKPHSNHRAKGRQHLAARLASMKPSFELESGLDRIEVFANGSEVVKDVLGRVKEVRSTNGIYMSFTYSIEGHLISFVRCDRLGTVHSYGEKDRHGVVVRDSNGRVMAQGEQMTVDGSGCLSIRKSDGQFWSVDAVRGIHRERRLLQNENGRLYGLTALFTADGFRMMTRFHPEASLSTPVAVALSACTEPLLHFGGIFRFYGRDGSMIQFDSEAALKKENPTHVWPAKSVNVEAAFKGKGQARSAWDAVRDYRTIYLSNV